MSGFTMAEAIIAAHSRDPVAPGNICGVRVDFAFANDITAPPSIKEFAGMGAKKVFDPARCAILPDHFTPNKDIASAEQAKISREFARAQGMLYWEVGRVGVEHAFLPEQGYILPGEIILGADSHTCTGGALGALATGVGSTDLAATWALGTTWLRVPETCRVDFEGSPSPWVGGKDLILSVIGKLGVEGARYMAIEFRGEGLLKLPLDGRMTMANMAIEAGGKAGLFVPDGATLDWVKARGKREYKPIFPDDDAVYAKRIAIDLDALEPVVALPHLPENVRPAKECKDMTIDQVFIGSCTNGRLTDIEQAVKILRGRRVHDRVRLIVIPASYEVYNTALERGYTRALTEAGAVVCTPTCGPCLGGYMGILAAGERCVSTSNRNFVGRMGSPKSEVILAGPMVAAASAILGRVADPREVN
ncbi:MAG: 3-isopropylmalate dehydratase large subunit [Synergistaceae bacterium]|jgi:3-isopropylmalate/(R)-2-methylmalate dehydratase large subunit|nr:3-isopropylmalate dehydratase large subunit [Synergistaceae bacterium]